MQKYGIVVDTNIIRSEGEKVVMDNVFNNTLTEIREFLSKNNITTSTIGIPEIVYQEATHQRLMKIEKSKNNITDSFDKLSIFGIRKPTTSYKNKNYGKILEGKSSNYLKDLSVSILKPPKNVFKEVSQRALEHRQPFRIEGDKGFKDTLCWLTVLNYFSKNKNYTCIFLTNNSLDFNDSLKPEFEKRTGNKIFFLSSIQDLKEYFDKEIPLGLELKKLREEISNEIKSKSGDLILRINKTEIQKNNSVSGSTYDSYVIHNFTGIAGGWGGSSCYQDEKELIAYNLDDLIVEDIRLVSDTTYQVDVILHAKGIYKDDSDAQTTHMYATISRLPFLERSTTTTFYITLQYSRKNGDMEILLCRKGLVR